MNGRVLNQERIFEVLLQNKSAGNFVDDPVSLCAQKLPQFNKKYIPGFLRLLEKRCAIIVFRRGVVTNNGGVIRRVRIIKDEFPADRRSLIKW